MSRTRWHILQDGDSYVLARHVPPRFDVMAQTLLPQAHPGRLARQIRQDMWRRLKHLRGFSPVVQLRAESGGIKVTAGGRVASAFGRDRVSQDIDDVLHDPRLRQRWLKWAAT